MAQLKARLKGFNNDSPRFLQGLPLFQASKTASYANCFDYAPCPPAPFPVMLRSLTATPRAFVRARARRGSGLRPSLGHVQAAGFAEVVLWRMSLTTRSLSQKPDIRALRQQQSGLATLSGISVSTSGGCHGVMV